jgi:flagellin
MIINTNINAQTTASLLSQSSSMLSQSLARLSSGSKVVSPADDSAGLAVSVQLVSQMGRVTAASNNIADANSFNQTQDGYLQQVSNALNRMSELAMPAVAARAFRERVRPEPGPGPYSANSCRRRDRR